MRLQESIKSALKKIAPARLTSELQQYRSYSTADRPSYVRLRILGWAGLPKPLLSTSSRLPDSILFVCFGNIMRSPMCEALMRGECAKHSYRPIVRSAGLNATPGRPAHPWAVEAAKDFGISLESHRARLLTGEMVDEAGIIFTMDYQNQVQIVSRYPQTRRKTFLLAAYAEDGRSEIADPYYSGQDETRRCFHTLATCVHNLVGSLQVTCRAGSQDG